LGTTVQLMQENSTLFIAWQLVPLKSKPGALSWSRRSDSQQPSIPKSRGSVLRLKRYAGVGRQVSDQSPVIEKAWIRRAGHCWLIYRRVYCSCRRWAQHGLHYLVGQAQLSSAQRRSPRDIRPTHTYINVVRCIVHRSSFIHYLTLAAAGSRAAAKIITPPTRKSLFPCNRDHPPQAVRFSTLHAEATHARMQTPPNE